MRDGSVRTRSGDRYKPKTIRGYEQALRIHIYPSLGGQKLSELHRNQVQDLVERLAAACAQPSTLRNAVMPLRVICRLADPAEAEALLAVLGESDRAIYATATYAGLRLGEIQALQVDDVDLERGVIHVRRGWDPEEGEQTPKSRAGERTVPIVAALRPELERALAVRQVGLVFGRTEERPFAPRTVNRRADSAWAEHGLKRITLHECRHTFASLMIAAGVNAKALQTFMGHASITDTLGRYGHLFPGAEGEAAALLDGFLSRRRGEAVGKSWGSSRPDQAAPGGLELSLTE